MANVKITDLPALATPDATDVVPAVDISADTTKKVTVGAILDTISGDVEVSSTGTSSIAAGAIVNADVNASAAIAGTKIAPDFGAQNVTTTGTSTAASFIPSSATVPTNGLYLPAANSVALATNSAVRLRVTSGGQVLLESANSFIGVNTTDGSDASTLLIGGGGAASSTRGAYVWMKGNENADPGALVLSAGNVGTAPITFVTGASERLYVDSSGRLLVGTSLQSGGALLQVNGDRVRIATAKTPASASAAGTAGEICWDADYVYVAVAANTWKRAALSTW